MDRTIKVNGNEYEFNNTSFSNSRTWGHETILYKNGGRISSNKSFYLNRTWESYQYQSCMKQAVWNLYDDQLRGAIDDYKMINDIKRLKKSIREKISEEFKANSELMEVYAKL